MAKTPLLCLLAIVALSAEALPQQKGSLLDKRGQRATALSKETRSTDPVTLPPAALFKVVKYSTPLGEMPAYLSQPHPDDDPDQAQPAIIWLTGGFPPCSPGDFLWTEADPANDQSARVYRQYGIRMMFPFVRGTADVCPGRQELFYGEVNDVIDAYHFLSKDPSVDKERIYLGGHSTGGTLALLVAESTDLFAGILALGPTEDDYGEDNAIYEWNEIERSLRAPIKHLSSVQTRTYVIEGQGGNSDSLEAMRSANKNPVIQFTLIPNADHFELIHPVNELFAQAILESEDGTLDISNSALEGSVLTYNVRMRETEDLHTLADLREAGTDFSQPQRMSHYLSAESEAPLDEFRKAAKKRGFELRDRGLRSDEGGVPFRLLTLDKTIRLTELESVFQCHQDAIDLAQAAEMQHWFWSIE